jgi:hypothetical protein
MGYCCVIAGSAYKSSNENELSHGWRVRTWPTSGTLS